MFQLSGVSLDYGRMKEHPRTHYAANGTPLLSWAALSDRKNASQSACRAVFFAEGKQIWDSGWLETAEQRIRYAGPQLPGGVKIGFALQIKDDAGNLSEVYEDDFYIARTEWRADWISTGEEIVEKNSYFRREIRVREGLKEAALYACGIGYHQIFVNGALIDDAKMDPAFTDYTKQCQYVLFPELEKILHPGYNCIGAIVASGWRNIQGIKWLIGHNSRFNGDSAFTAMLRLRYADGSEEWICTDENWQAGRGAWTFASVFDGTIYDARESRVGWADVGFKGDFASAQIVPGPGGKMEPMTLQPIFEGKIREPIAVWPDGENAVVLDFGQNMAGVARVRLPEKMQRGQEIRMTFTEELTEDGRLFRDTLRGAKAEDRYIASGDERDLHVWQAEFTYHGFRYARIEGLGAGFDAAKNVRAVEIHTDLETRSHFRCGNALVTRIHEACVETERGNMHSILTDCPQRDERMGWMNDATVRFEETPYNFDIGRIFPKIVRDLMDTQDETGGIGCTAPFIAGNIPADPVCSSFLMAGLESVLHKGNFDVIREAFAAYEAWEKYLLSRSEGYIVDYSYYGDWAGPLYACVPQESGVPGAVSAVTPGVFMSTGYSYLNCRLLSQFAKWLDMPEKQAEYEALGAKIRAAMLEKWYDGNGTMATGSQGSQAFSLWLGLIPEEDCAAAAKIMRDDLVERGYDFTTGNLCTRYLMDMLTKYGYGEDAWRLITKETCPSFGFMLQQEATTIWERFELMTDANMNSHNHPMYAAVDYWMYAYLIGAKPALPGWREFTVEPFMPEALQSAQAVIDTMQGEIAVRWTKRYDEKHLQISVPFGCTAHVRFGGKTHTVGSGFYTFHA